MNMVYVPDKETVTAHFVTGEMFILAITYDEETAAIAPIDEAPEHYILLNKAGIGEINLDRCFRVIFDDKAAEWTFVCPSDYAHISDRQKRIAQFYKDGFRTIPHVLSDLGYMIDLTIRRNRVEDSIEMQGSDKLYRDAYAEALAAGHDAIYADSYATILTYTNEFPSKDYATLYAKDYADAYRECYSEYNSNIGADVFAEGFAKGYVESQINRIRTLMQDLDMTFDQVAETLCISDDDRPHYFNLLFQRGDQKMTGREDKKENDLFYTCSLIDYIARKTKNRRAAIVNALGKDRLTKIYDLADIYHSDNIDRVSDDFIEAACILPGKFDNVADAKYAVPSHWDIGKVYKRLILGIVKERGTDVIDALIAAYNSFVSDKIDDYNSSFYYDNPQSILQTFLSGKLE